MKILILALFFIILIGIGIFFKNSGLFKNPLREGVAPAATYTVGAPSPANSDIAPDGECIAQNSYIGDVLTNCETAAMVASCTAATDLGGCDAAGGVDNKCCFWKSEPVVDCSGSWTACSNTCGPGVQTYEITQPWRQGGASCPYNKNETRVCDGTIGCKDKKDCVGSWGECIARDPTKKCGPGIQTYTLSVPATAGGEICPHATGDTQSCFEAECIADIPAVPVNCEGHWNDCSASCGPGFGIQRYVITKPSANGGNPCAHNQNDSQVCNRPECPADCESSWGPPCPTKCGIVQEQTYTITTPQAYGGAQCNPQHTVGDTRKCPVIKCPLKCDGTWDICDSSCSTKNGSDSELSGTQTFTITQPAVAGGGKCSDISNALYMPVGGEGRGCAGAITSDGSQSSYYCEGGGSSGTEFEWLSECCMWDMDTTSCKPKDVGTPEDDEAQEKSDKTFIANNNLNCPEKKTKVCKTSCPKCDKQGQYLAINDASCPGLDWTQATDFTGSIGGSYDVSNSCCMNCPNGQTTKPRTDDVSNLIGDCYYDKACDNPVGTECLTNGFCKKYSSSTDAMKTGCKKYCNNGYYISNRVGNTTCNQITKPHVCEGSDVLINDNNGYAKFKYVDATFRPSPPPPIKCNSNQYCIATSNTDGVCQNKYGNVGACTGNISLNESNECNNGRKWLGKYTSDTGKFGIGCETTVRNIFSDHGIKADTFEYNANGSVFIGSGNCQMDCSGYWFNNPSCNDGYITHSFITDPNTPKNNGMTCLEQAKRSFDYNKDASEFIVMGIPHTASINDIKEDENGNISIKKACHIDCSGVWPDFSATTCPTSSAGVDANTLSRTFAIANQPQYIGANSCYDLAVDLSSNPFPHTTSSITQDGDNIIQKVFCSQDCIGVWDKAADATCNNGTIPLTWKTTSESINGGKTCDIVAKSTYGNEYNYTQDSIQTTSWIGPVQCGGGIDKWDCTTNISCPVDCSYTISPWSACTKGKRSSIVKIHDYGRNDGAKCPYRDKTEIWENCTMPFPLPVQTPDEYITELPCKLDNRPGTEKCSDKCVPYLPPYCENINQGVDENGNPVNGICCPFYDPAAKVNCQSCGTVKYNDASKEIQSNIIKMHDNDTSGIPEWEKQLSNLSQNSQNVLSDILGKIF